jgi:hypothetical protein
MAFADIDFLVPYSGLPDKSEQEDAPVDENPETPEESPADWLAFFQSYGYLNSATSVSDWWGSHRENIDLSGLSMGSMTDLPTETWGAVVDNSFQYCPGDFGCDYSSTYGIINGSLDLSNNGLSSLYFLEGIAGVDGKLNLSGNTISGVGLRKLEYIGPEGATNPSTIVYDLSNTTINRPTLTRLIIRGGLDLTNATMPNPYDIFNYLYMVGDIHLEGVTSVTSLKPLQAVRLLEGADIYLSANPGQYIGEKPTDQPAHSNSLCDSLMYGSSKVYFGGVEGHWSDICDMVMY